MTTVSGAVDRPEWTTWADLLAVLVLLTVGDLAVLFVADGSLVRLVLSLPLLFLPGYALVAALFPKVPDDGSDADDRFSTIAAPGHVERIALSLAGTLVVVPLVALVVNFSPFDLTTLPLLVGTTVTTVAIVATAAWRRASLPADQRYGPTADDVAALRPAFPTANERWLPTLVLVAGLLVAAATTGYALTVPPQNEEFSEFYLLSGGETLDSNGYPAELSLNETATVTVAVENHEGESVNYTVVASLQRVREQNGTTRVLEKQELDRFSSQVGPNGRWQVDHELSPTLIGSDLRLTYLLYQGEPPADPTAATADRTLHLWIDVSAE